MITDPARRSSRHANKRPTRQDPIKPPRVLNSYAQSARCRVTPYLSNLLYMPGAWDEHIRLLVAFSDLRAGDPTSRTRPAQPGSTVNGSSQGGV